MLENTSENIPEVEVFDKSIVIAKNSRIPVSEIFGPVIQGEGSLAGTPTIFVRTGGCDYKCTWCDSMYSVDKKTYGKEWEKLTIPEIFNRITSLTWGKPILVTFSGGNPAMWDFASLIEAGKKHNFTFACETQGTLSPEWFSKLDHLVLSPKPPSSGEVTDWDKLQKCVDVGWDLFSTSRGVFKVVVSNREDYEYAKLVRTKYPYLPFYLSICSELVGSTPYIRHQIAVKYNEVLEWMKQDQLYDVKLGFQQHVMIYGNKRGV